MSNPTVLTKYPDDIDDIVTNIVIMAGQSVLPVVKSRFLSDI